MTDRQLTWAEQVAMDREQFIDEMVARGYRLRRDDSDGLTSSAELANDVVRVVLGEGFPYRPPSVFADVPVKLSWHLEPPNKLCLYTTAEREARPWEVAEALDNRIDEWFRKNDAGWPDDPPVLDLEAYFDLPVDPRLLVFDHLERHDGDHVTLSETPVSMHIVQQGRPSKKSRKRCLAGFVTNIGQLDEPVSTLEDVLERVPVADADVVRHGLVTRRLEVLIVRYRRSSVWGAVALTFTAGETRRALVAPGDARSRQLRAGPDADRLSTTSVYIVGVGALGSHIADGLSRAGVGNLTLRDGDLYLPGNAPRHLVGLSGFYGYRKAQAVKAVLDARTYSSAEIVADPTSLTDPGEAALLLAGDALVVDATADGSVLGMLSDTAVVSGTLFVSACLQNDGRTMRVDVIPPLGNEKSLDPTERRPSTSPERFEAGCGDPVSPTPPHAVAEAAAMSVRHICALLLGEPIHGAGEVREW